MLQEAVVVVLAGAVTPGHRDGQQCCLPSRVIRFAARPSWPGSSGNGTDSRLRKASLEGACRAECRCAASRHTKVLPGRLEVVSGDQAELPGPRGGLSAVGGAELAQDVGHVLFDRVERHYQIVGDALV
jgi:hypothetical protein